MKVEIYSFLLFKHSQPSPPSRSFFQSLPSPDETWKITKTNLITSLQSSSPSASDAPLSLSLSLSISHPLSLYPSLFSLFRCLPHHLSLSLSLVPLYHTLSIIPSLSMYLTLSLTSLCTSLYHNAAFPASNPPLLC